MDWSFEIPDNAKNYRGNQKRTLPVILHYDSVEATSKHSLEVKQLKTTEDLIKLKEQGHVM